MTGLTDITARIAAAAAEVDRDPADIELIAVSKVQPLARVEAVLEAGHRRFGENRVQEAQGKWPDLRDRYGEIDLHLIGPLQTNKVRAAMDLFDVIQTLDRNRLAVKIATEAQERGTCPGLYIQVNTGREKQKAGIDPDETDAFVNRCREEYDLPILGLMAIPPADEPATAHFDLLAQLAERNGLSGLSMGMSADFEEAIRYGATAVRVGSAIFGARVPGAATGG